MQLSGRTKLCLVGALVGAVFGLVLGAVVAAAIHFSGFAGASWNGKLEVVALLTGLCTLGGFIQGWSASSEP